jgi:hypothetical protein
MVVPDYRGPCLSNVVPALLARDHGLPAWLPAEADARQVVLLVLDGLGWEQLRERVASAPTLSGMTGGPITSVVPSTTATALTSIATGVPPARHGVVGYRVKVGPAVVMNVLRWVTAQGDARVTVPPDEFQPIEPFAGTRPPVVGIDKVAHAFGLGDHYEAEVRATDRLVVDLLGVLPSDAALVVTSDHGQVDVGRNVVGLHNDVMARTTLLSGEGRFRWLHARAGASDRLAEVARERHGHQAWVRTRDEAVAEGWFGGELSRAAESRLGDVVLAASEPVAFLDPADVAEARMVSRHGSLTPAEMWVPLLVARA